MKYERRFSTGNPYESVSWELRTAEILQDGKPVFRQENVKSPSSWSQLAVNIVASKYFYGSVGDPNRETGIDQLIKRVVDTITLMVVGDSYFGDDPESYQAFSDDLAYLMLHQYASFNSPVWFNVGLYDKYGATSESGSWRFDRNSQRAVLARDSYKYPAVSACYIQHVDDSLDSIMDLARSEAMLFKYGSGSGSNLSTLRSAHETLSGGGKPSGPISFMRVYDQIAEVVASGGKTRRAALLKCLDVDHPDIAEFISCKATEESHANMLVERGVDPSRAIKSVMYQNMNISVRVSDSFMEAVENDDEWCTHWVTNTSKEGPKCKARHLWEKIASSAWSCGDPGLQYDSTINKWHTIPKSGRINASNPCLAAGTLMLTQNGYQPIESLLETEVYINDGLKLQPSTVWRVGVKPVIKLKIENSTTLVLTPNHKLLTEDGWIEAKDCLYKRLERLDPQAGEHECPQVLSIEDAGVAEVYDFSTPSTKAGVANGVIVHNCSEYMSIDNTACNLASINLLKFYAKTTGFAWTEFENAIRVMIIAQDALIDNASYPIKDVAVNAHRCRQLGLGYTNLGALLMANGFPYDSDAGRCLCGCITAVLTARAYLTSAEIASKLEPFDEWEHNATPMRDVLKKHLMAANQLVGDGSERARELWQLVAECDSFRNSQVTVLAPTGTISFMMDADTLGIEPDICLVKSKSLVGGGTIQIVNNSVAAGLRAIGFCDIDIESALEYLMEKHTLRGYPGIEEGYNLEVFATSLGDNTIPWKAHVTMMAAAQPFLSGAISKTVNMPSNSTVEDMSNAYMLGWKLGLKSIALYRDGSKAMQPVNVKKETEVVKARREHLPDTRQSITHKFTVGSNQGYFTVGLYPDGRPGELFISVAKEGSTLGGLFDCFGVAISVSLQYGVPLREFIDKFSHVRFEPMGFTKNPQIRVAKSIIDYIFRWLENHFAQDEVVKIVPLAVEPVATLDAPICDNCGQLCVRVGSCYLCYSCGTSGGCS